MRDGDCFPMKLRAVGATPDTARALRSALQQAGVIDVEAVVCATLVPHFGATAPHEVVVYLRPEDHGLQAALAAWQGQPPGAVTVVAPGLDPARAQALAAAGVAAIANSLDGVALRAALVWSRACHARQAALRDELAQARAQLDERKWLDRAKGLLMAARGMAEDEAFKLLRGAAMHANLRLVEVSRSVVDAARWAESLNRAGQLRMLSQRLLALGAQRLAQVDGAQARSLQTHAVRRVQHNLDHLAALDLAADAAAALAATRAAWSAFRSMLGARLQLANLRAADAGAETLLAAADRLTGALEAHGGRRALAIVNLCGSQRMRAQRLVKDALLCALLDPVAATSVLLRTSADYEQVQRQIEAVPLSSPEIRAALDAVQAGWLTLQRALRATDLAAVVGAGEQLLQAVDRLTDHYEHSLQVLMS